jgi:phosphoribosylformylglycinamidine (FGAM) synthase-like amidotransferase family enzyme
MYPVLYAQPKGNGYQLINAMPEIVFIILKTNSKDRFIIKNKNGSFTKTNDIWVAEFYEDDKFQIQKYQVKF